MRQDIVKREVEEKAGGGQRSEINLWKSKHSRHPSASQRTASRYQLQRAAKSLLFKDVGNHFPRYLTDPLEHEVGDVPLED